MQTLERDRIRTGPGDRSRVLPAAIAVALTVGVLARLTTRSGLWLDEALSVHIARLPLEQIPAALRRDGAPPVYYLLLHGWMAVFGPSAAAVRALSTVFGVAALPAVWLLGRRLRDRATAWLAILLLASSPFAVHYATEARMYALVVFEVVLLGLMLLRAAERPSWGRLAGVSIACAALVLTHYWSLFLMVALAAVLLRRRLHRLLAAQAASALLVLPWLPTLAFQVRHTGTPWAPAPSLSAALDTVTAWAGGSSGGGQVLSLLLLALFVLALLGRTTSAGVLLARPRDRTAGDLALLAAGTLLLGLLIGQVVRAGYAPRYSSIALAPALLLGALGLRVLSGRTRIALTCLTVGLGLLGSVGNPFDDRKTQAGQVAAVLRSRLAPGDVVVICPDQLGPALADLLPAGAAAVVYPTLAGPDRVDWVDYAERNAAASPTAFVQEVLRRAGAHTVWLVTEPGYRTFGRACSQVGHILTARAAKTAKLVSSNRHFAEREALFRFTGRR